MGNIACVPQAPGGFRSSFRRKPSLKKDQNGKKKLPSFFGIDGSQERDTTTDKILQYIPAKIIQKQENQKENLDQRLPSLFKKGRRKTIVRNLGKMIYYSKVKFRFQHCQEVNSCFLELFQSYLYFQSTGPNGLTYQGLLPLKELEVRELGAGQSPGQQEHAFHISGPLLNPLVVFCPSEAELRQWLYHLEKQIQLCGGSLALPLLSQSGWTQSQGDKEELRWSMQNLPVQEWRGTQRESLGEILCVSKVKLQHLPFQEQHDRLLVLYPSTLVIVSEEPSGLCFKGELPLNAIQVLFEENDKTSFLIEGRLINSIRVSCGSYQDYQEWLYCLNTAQFRNADSSLSGSEGISGARIPQPSQFTSSGRGSLSSDGRTNSWASGGRVTTLTQLSQTSGSLPDGHSFLLPPEGRLLEEPLSPGYSQPLHSLAQPGWPSPGLSPQRELCRGNSSRRSQGRSGQERSACGLVPPNPKGEAQSPVYHEPYTAHGSQGTQGTEGTQSSQQQPPGQLEMGRLPPVPVDHWECPMAPLRPLPEEDEDGEEFVGRAEPAILARPEVPAVPRAARPVSPGAVPGAVALPAPAGGARQGGAPRPHLQHPGPPTAAPAPGTRTRLLPGADLLPARGTPGTFSARPRRERGHPRGDRCHLSLPGLRLLPRLRRAAELPQRPQLRQPVGGRGEGAGLPLQPPCCRPAHLPRLGAAPGTEKKKKNPGALLSSSGRRREEP